MTLRIGTRASTLARSQAGTVADALGAELVLIVSEGDRSTESLASLGGSGVFATALREALRAGEVDAVVHSFKDLPTTPADGLAIAAVPKRADARDVVCARGGLDLAGLPEGARVGTGSPRRRAQLAAKRPDLVLVDIRGQHRLAAGPSHHRRPGARARRGHPRRGGTRADRSPRRRDRVPLARHVADRTRPGRARRRDARRRRASRRGARSPADPLAAEAERGVLARLEAGCAAPIGAHAFIEDELMFLTARVYRPDGGERITSSHAMPPDDDAPAELAARVADELLSLGAARLAPLHD